MSRTWKDLKFIALAAELVRVLDHTGESYLAHSSPAPRWARNPSCFNRSIPVDRKSAICVWFSDFTAPGVSITL